MNLWMVNLLLFLLLAVLCAMPALGWFLLLNARSLEASGIPYCLRCGYNLTGITSARCPECGGPTTPNSLQTGGRPVLRRRQMILGVMLLVTSGVIFAAMLFGLLRR